MSRSISRIITLLSCLAAFLCMSCVDEKEYSDSNAGNFEALWKIMDEHYCFFDEKARAYGVDWQEVHDRYAPSAYSGLSRSQLFELCCNMIGELRDGHVNLSSPWDYGREWSWKENYPTNLSDTLLRKYLGTDYRISCGMQYRILEDNIGYIYYPSFNESIGDGNLDYILLYLSTCQGLILDIRSNGGGQVTTAEKLARRFTTQEVHVGYIRHKTGKGHNDFSDPERQTIKPSPGLVWPHKVCVLTNRGVFSSANEFTKYMKAIGKATGKVSIIGDTTGGGGGMPFTSELPNGWTVRFSACPMYDADGKSIEQGIAPDYHIDLTDEDFQKGEDTIIEFARRLLKAPDTH